MENGVAASPITTGTINGTFSTNNTGTSTSTRLSPAENRKYSKNIMISTASINPASSIDNELICASTSTASKSIIRLFGTTAHTTAATAATSGLFSRLIAPIFAFIISTATSDITKRMPISITIAYLLYTFLYHSLIISRFVILPSS